MIPEPPLETIKDVSVYDTRGFEDTARLDADGFECLRYPALRSLGPDKMDQTVEYITAVVDLMKRKLNAELVVCYDYRVR